MRRTSIDRHEWRICLIDASSFTRLCFGTAWYPAITILFTYGALKLICIEIRHSSAFITRHAECNDAASRVNIVLERELSDGYIHIMIVSSTIGNS